MPESDFDKKVEALRDQPTVTGRVVTESADSVVLRVGGALVEVPTRSIASRAAAAGAAAGAAAAAPGEITLTLAPDAQVLVSSVVPVGGGLVSGNVFAGLRSGPMASNCNCNCNVASGVSAQVAPFAAAVPRPALASNCNCNCNCDVASAVSAQLAPLAAVVPRPALASNCNCNCNCGGGESVAASPVRAAARLLDGGSGGNCNCNCNCSEAAAAAMAAAAMAFRRPLVGGMMGAFA